MKGLAVHCTEPSSLLTYAHIHGWEWPSGATGPPSRIEHYIYFLLEGGSLTIRHGHGSHLEDYQCLKWPEQKLEVMLYLNELKHYRSLEYIITNIRKEVNHATRN